MQKDIKRERTTITGTSNGRTANNGMEKRIQERLNEHERNAKNDLIQGGTA
jgi:hypothetical protein